MSIKPKISWLAWPINVYSVTQYLLQEQWHKNEAQISPKLISYAGRFLLGNAFLGNSVAWAAEEQEWGIATMFRTASIPYDVWWWPISSTRLCRCCSSRTITYLSTALKWAHTSIKPMMKSGHWTLFLIMRFIDIPASEQKRHWRWYRRFRCSIYLSTWWAMGRRNEWWQWIQLYGNLRAKAKYKTGGPGVFSERYVALQKCRFQQ